MEEKHRIVFELCDNKEDELIDAKELELAVRSKQIRMLGTEVLRKALIPEEGNGSPIRGMA